MEEPKRFNEILRDAMDARDYNIEKLAAATGVAEQFIRALAANESHVVPPATYARGYINKIAKVLDVPQSELWGPYEREYQPKSSGGADLMPQNRFAIAAINKRFVVAIAIGILVVIYIAANFNRLIGLPHLTIIAPKESMTISRVDTITIKGAIENPKDTLTVNDASVAVGADGFFEHVFTLDPGTNTFVVTAKRFLGRNVTETLQVNYEPPEPTASPPIRATSTPRILPSNH